MKTNLLIKENPLQVIPTLAVKIGLNEAIVLQQLHYWMGKNVGKIIDGKKWVFNSYKNWQNDNFPFWSQATIKRIFSSLEEKNLISTMQLDTYDRRKYYTINYDDFDAIVSSCADASGQNDLMEEVKMSQSNGSKCADVKSEITTYTTTEITSDVNDTSSNKNPFSEKEKCVEVFHEITGLTLDYSRQVKMCTDMQSAWEKRGMDYEKFVSYLKGVYHNWCMTRRKDFPELKLSPQNPAWLEWAIIGKYANKTDKQSDIEKGFYI